MADLIQTLSNIYVSFSQQIPEKLAVYTILIAVYAIFIWKFYKFLAKKNIIELDLKQYNTTEHPGLNKFFASLLFLAEYIIILPVLVFFWFSIFSIFLLVLSKGQDVGQILLISAAIIASTRLASYYSQDLSKDLAKMFPFTVLAVFLLEPKFFNISELFLRFSEIPLLLNNILIYLVFILGLEIIMRSLFTILDLFSSKEL